MPPPASLSNFPAIPGTGNDLPSRLDAEPLRLEPIGLTDQPLRDSDNFGSAPTSLGLWGFGKRDENYQPIKVNVQVVDTNQNGELDGDDTVFVERIDSNQKEVNVGGTSIRIENSVTTTQESVYEHVRFKKNEWGEPSERLRDVAAWASLPISASLTRYTEQLDKMRSRERDAIKITDHGEFAIRLREAVIDGRLKLGHFYDSGAPYSHLHHSFKNQSEAAALVSSQFGAFLKDNPNWSFDDLLEWNRVRFGGFENANLSMLYFYGYMPDRPAWADSLTYSFPPPDVAAILGKPLGK